MLTRHANGPRQGRLRQNLGTGACLLLPRELLVELQLQRQLLVVLEPALLVLVKRVVEDGEDALGRDGVGRVGENGTQHELESWCLGGDVI